MPRQVLPAPTGAALLPDVPHWSWHEYGMRVGVWRFFDLFQRRGIRPTLADQRARLRGLSAGRRGGAGAGWEFMGHAYDQMPIHKDRRSGGHDHPLDGYSGALHRHAAGRLARPGPDPDAETPDSSPTPASNISATGSMTTSRP